MSSTRRLGWTALTLLALAGCDNTPAPPSTSPNVAPSTAAPAASPDAPKNEVKSLPVETPKGADAGKLSAENIAEIKKLPAEDQALALAQVTCPVSDEKLGGEMGIPIKQEVDGKTFFLCCAGCKDKVKADPAKYLAKLKK